MRKIALIAILSFVFLTGAGCPGKMPKMDRPISLYAGCPQFEGICKFSKEQVEEKVSPNLKSIAKEDVSEWIELNIDGVITKKVRVLPAKSKEFKKFTALPNDDLGILMKYIDDLKRAVGK